MLFLSAFLSLASFREDEALDCTRNPKHKHTRYMSFFKHREKGKIMHIEKKIKQMGHILFPLFSLYVTGTATRLYQ
jgi:hypothetical protein